MSDNINYIKLLHTESTVEAEQVISHLKKNNVNAYKQGDIASVYMGDSFGGADVFVLEKDMQFAKEALKDYQPIKTRSTRNNRIYSDSQRVLGWILVIIMIVCIVVPIILIL